MSSRSSRESLVCFWSFFPPLDLFDDIFFPPPNFLPAEWSFLPPLAEDEPDFLPAFEPDFFPPPEPPLDKPLRLLSVGHDGASVSILINGVGSAVTVGTITIEGGLVGDIVGTAKDGSSVGGIVG